MASNSTGVAIDNNEKVFYEKIDEYINSLHKNHHEKCVIKRQVYNDILKYLLLRKEAPCNPYSSKFVYWTKSNFNSIKIAGSEIVIFCVKLKKPMCVYEVFYNVISEAHITVSHGDRENTYSEIISQYSWREWTINMNRLFIIAIVYLAIQGTTADIKKKRQECRDYVGDRANCQRFVRCFHNLRVLFTCASGTVYEPKLKTCIEKELVTDCDDSKDRVEIIISSNVTVSDDDYPTIEADEDALNIISLKDITGKDSSTNVQKQFGCGSYCKNQGLCVIVAQAVTCQCQSGYTGHQCQITQFLISTREGCNPNPCDNGATCIEIYPNTINCTCPPGFVGSLCSYPDITTTITPITDNPNRLCLVNPCLNGAFCLTVLGGGFRCVCQTGYTGLLCDYPDNPTSTGCGISNPCINSGICIPTLIGYQCQCLDNYVGSYCQTNIALVVLPLPNQCQPSPCQNGGTCYLRQGTFGCSCPIGYSGVCCEINLAATNPCYTNPCVNGGTCQIAGPNLFRCVCPAGFNGLRCELRVCDPNPCLYGGICIIIGNSFQCQCPPQYTGPTCAILIPPPNPCLSQPCLHGGTCTPTGPTTFVCSCTPSYYGPCCEIRNYCIPNPCYNGGSCVATTTGYLCQCSFPFTGSNCETLITTPVPRPVCACVVCPCPTPVVTMVNPCLPNPCQNNGGCAVVQNIARCYCPGSFRGYYCQFARKRAMSNAPCANMTCMNGGECFVNENGPQCTCPKPYYGKNCELINRPRTCTPSPCGKDGQCVITQDGYKCLCKNDTTGVLCEQKIMPKNYRWCPIDCRSGTSCVYEGSTPKCRAL
ncbi:unnamed protein product [Rotaria sordida]|uniref:Uncharacterized protein n=1 Tax=Rotaria sordida TaxID=392033 RepID=A0A814YD96_9BILA|nr:unnamed protein product [Rotaria sordida]